MALDFSIDTATYPKATRYPQRHGYQLRGTTPTSILIHSTNNRRAGTAFTGEATYLFESAEVSAHYLIGKAGPIARFLHPKTWQAWHAGEARPEFANPRSIGVELHTSVGERPTQIQKDACAWLCGQLMAEYAIPSGMIETHRYAALPKGRKTDPEGWSNEDFYRWRAALISTDPDPWLRWGTAYPLDPHQRGWKIPQVWLRNTWLGEARSFETYSPDGQRSIQWFKEGWVIYEKQVDWAMHYRASKPVA